MFTIEVLPALHGDALWIEYGDAARPHRVLVDGGPSSTVLRETIEGLVADRIGPTRRGEHDFDLITVSHIDADHITGLLSLFENRAIDLAPHDVWFNGWEHLPTDVLGAKQAERLSAAIVDRRLPWNDRLGNNAVMVPDDGQLPVVELPGGMRLTLLSPTREALAELRPVWRREVEQAGLVPGKAAEDALDAQPDVLGDERLDPEELAAKAFEDDDSEANRASIAFLAEFDGRSALFTGDAHADILAASLRRLAAERGVDVVPVDVFKVSHHGSRHNIDAELLGLVECVRYVFSTNGARHHHPDRVAVSRVVTAHQHDITLECNYRTEFTEPWESRRLRRAFDYDVIYPEDGQPWLCVEV